MIAQLSGTVIAAGPTWVVLDLNGFGVKGAQRLVIELKDKINALAAVGPPSAQPVPLIWREQVKGGLEGLGWSSRDAERACDSVAGLIEADPSTPVAVLMRAALRSLAK